MSGQFQTPITIKEAIKHIDTNYYLLPAIQRKFVWSPYQIEMLFDSIMRGYPINSFMFWEINDSKIKEGYIFYEVLHTYRQRYNEENPEHSTKGMPNFISIIDGQQRLTSLYIGLKGTYAYKLPRKWWANTEDNLPTRILYLDINSTLEQENNTEKKYNFKFLTKKESENKTGSQHHWFEVGQVLNWNGLNQINSYLHQQGFDTNTVQAEILCRLFEVIHKDKLINFYLETEQDSDQVLEIFIRTNSGGTRLSFSDLLLSMSIANWDKLDPRKEINTLINHINSEYQIIFNRDFILKTCLVLCENDIRFKLKNFTKENISKFEDNWKRIRESIIAGTKLVYYLGHNEYTLRAKNALIPIIYYIYKNQLEGEINNPNQHLKNRQTIHKWLNISLIKGTFSGQSDFTLSRIRKVISDNSSDKLFPFAQIVKTFKGTRLDYSFTDEFITEILKYQKDSPGANNILPLLYSDKNYFEQGYHIDHMHPQSRFKNGEIAKAVGREEQFVNDPSIWNSILNLQVLAGKINTSKNGKTLDKWAKDHSVNKEQLFVKNDTSLEEKDYLQFIEARKEILTKKIKELIQE